MRRTALALVISVAAVFPLRAQPAPYWFKTYSLVPYKEYWTLTLEVRSLKKSLPKILDIFSKGKASLMVPLSNLVSSQHPPSQQLRYKLARSSARDIEKKLKKLGTLSPSQIRPEPNIPPLAEVKEKIARLEAMKKDREPALAPDAQAMVNEALEHLRFVERAQAERGAEVLLNMTVLETTP